MNGHHLIISGTGRAGTTFLVQLFTELGLDTGYPDRQSGLFEHCDAGMEWDLTSEHLPYVLKSPFLCVWLDRLLDERGLVIDRAIVPMRALHAAAESRRDVMRRTPGAPREPGQPSRPGLDLVPGGVFPVGGTGENQEAVLTHMLYELILTLTRREIPTTLLEFPRLVHDARYLFKHIGALVPGCDEARFTQAFRTVARPELVHDFVPD